MAKRSDNDLFQNTTMTFGEHLEELRVCLTKAVFGLLIGSVIGFFVSKHVVNFIESPVLSALKRHMVESAKLDLREKYGDRVTDDMLSVLDKRVLVVEEVYLERNELSRITNPAGVTAAEKAAQTPVSSESAVFDAKLSAPTVDFVKTRIWREAQAKIQSLDPWETFMIYLKASLVVGAVLASPYIFWQIWTFVAAGLYLH